MDAKDARDALEQIAQTRVNVAARSKAPSGYYAAVGVLQALFLISITLESPWSFLLLIPGIAAVGFLAGWYRRSAGTWGLGDMKGEGSWLFWLIVAVTIIAFALVIILQTVLISLVSGGAVFITYATLGPLWDRAYQSQVAQR